MIVSPYVRPIILGLCFLVLTMMAYRPVFAASENNNLSLRISYGQSAPSTSRLLDADCQASDPPAYFGCGTGSDGLPRGVEGGLSHHGFLEIGLGYQFNRWLSFEVALSQNKAVDYEGFANFNGLDTDDQPVSAKGSYQRFVSTARVNVLTLFDQHYEGAYPFVEVGAGFSNNQVNAVNYAFPTARINVNTITQGGKATQFVWSLGGGFSAPMTDDVHLELLFRRTDMGRFETDPGTVIAIRTDRTLEFPAGGTQFSSKSDEFLFGIRYLF